MHYSVIRVRCIIQYSFSYYHRIVFYSLLVQGGGYMIKTERSDILKCYIYGYCIPKLKLNLTYLVSLRQTFFLFLKNKNVYCTEMNLPQLHDWQSYFITHLLGRTL